MRRQVLIGVLCLWGLGLSAAWSMAVPKSPEPAKILRSIIIQGNTVLTKSQILTLMQSQIGQRYDPEIFRQDLHTILREYHRRGYIYAGLSSWFVRRFPDGVYISIRLNEGRIGTIQVRGNTHTRTQTILQELLFRPNDLYNEEDRIESERILRRQPHLGEVRINSRFNRKTRRVDIVVHVLDRWTLFPSASLPRFGGGEFDVILALTDTNIAGKGQTGRIRYVRTQEDHDTRHFFSTLFMEPRMFGSHWAFLANYTQNRLGDSWEVRLQRPFYSLRTRWAASLQSYDTIGLAKWYRDGEVLDEFRQHLRGQALQLTYALGKPHAQARLSGWYLHRQNQFAPLRPPQEARFEREEVHLGGVSLLWRRVQFVRDTFVDKLGEMEDLELGHAHGISVGRSLSMLGDERREIRLSLQSWMRRYLPYRGYLATNLALEARRFPQTWRDVLIRGDVRLLIRRWSPYLLSARLLTKLALYAEGRHQVLLGGPQSLRGYPSHAFEGDRLILLNLEARRIFLRHPLVVIGGALFSDMGYLWNSQQGFQPAQLKRSLGIGLRVGLPRLSGAPVYRLDIAWAIDSEQPFKWRNALIFAIGPLIRIGSSR